jgi:hypothetical protein
MGFLFTVPMGFLFTATLTFLFTMTLGFQLTISKSPYSRSKRLSYSVRNLSK